MADREARFGVSTYQVRVSREISPSGILYVSADTITVTPAGALILSVEVTPVENAEDDTSGIEVTPGTVFAPGYWYSVVEVTPDSHLPFFIVAD